MMGIPPKKVTLRRAVAALGISRALVAAAVARQRRTTARRAASTAGGREEVGAVPSSTSNRRGAARASGRLTTTLLGGGCKKTASVKKTSTGKRAAPFGRRGGSPPPQKKAGGASGGGGRTTASPPMTQTTMMTMEDDTSTTASASPGDQRTDPAASPAAAEEEAETQAPLVAEEELAKGFAAALMQMAALAPAPEGRRVTCFHAHIPPSIGIGEYVARIRRFFGCSGSCYVLALIYIDRLMKRHPDVTISNLSCHRLLVTSMMVAAKFHDDVFFSNTYYAKVGGVRLQEINALETHFVKLLDWKLQVQPEEFSNYSCLCRAAAQEA